MTVLEAWKEISTRSPRPRVTSGRESWRSRSPHIANNNASSGYVSRQEY